MNDDYNKMTFEMIIDFLPKTPTVYCHRGEIERDNFVFEH